MIEYHNLIYLISIIVLLIISAFFSGSETGFTASSEGKIHRLAKDGNKRAKIVEKLLAKRDKLMATILIGNNIVNILASALATGLAIEYFGGDKGVLLATAIMTILIVIFSEITPKTYALKKSEKIALFLSPFLLFFSKILTPLTFFSTKFTNLLYKEKEGNKTSPSSHLEEIRGVVELKHSQGAFLKSDKDMINGVLDLKEVEISEIITHRKDVKSINIKQDLKLIIKQAFEINHSKIPLWEKNEDNIISILDMRQLILNINKYSGDLSKIKLQNITSKPLFIPPQNRIGHQLMDFKQKKESVAIVVDEYGTIDGLVTLADIIEEIIGEFDHEGKSKITKLPHEHFKIDGKVPIRDVNRELNWNLKENDDNSSTISGFVITNIGKIPEENEEFEFDGFRFRILQKQNNQIKSLTIKKLPKLEEDYD